jgi:tRNA U55 pseudouridine synthase TruB
MDSLVRRWPAVKLSEEFARRFTFGQAISRNNLPEYMSSGAPSLEKQGGGLMRVYTQDDAFLGLGEVDPVGSLRPHRLVSGA